MPEPGDEVGAWVAFGTLRIDFGAREVLSAGELVELTKIEFDLLEALARTPRVVVSRQQLVEAVWEGTRYGDHHMIDVHIGNLRRKLGESGRDQGFIKTVRGIGYKFDSRHQGPAEHRPADVADMADADAARQRGEAAPTTAASSDLVPTDLTTVAGQELVQPVGNYDWTGDWLEEASMPGSVELVFGVDLRLMSVNPPDARIAGWRVQDYIGRWFSPVRSAPGAASTAHVAQTLHAMRRGGVEEWRSRVTAMHTDGSAIEVTARTRTILDEEGTIIGLRVIMREVAPVKGPSGVSSATGQAPVDLSDRSSARRGRVLNSA